MLLAPLSELAVRQPWSPSQCFFGTQMTELGPTFKDNCLIGVFSYAVGSWGPEKGSDNSVIIRLRQIYAFVAELWRMSWRPLALSASTFPPWTPRYSERKAFSIKIQYLCLCGYVSGPVLSGLMTVSQDMNEMSGSVWIHLGSRYVWGKKNLCFYSCYTSNVSYLKGGRTLLHSTSSSLWCGSWIQSVRWSLFV